MAKTGYNRYTGQPTNPKNFYVDPANLSVEILKSQDLSVCTDELANMCQKIVKNVINWPRFRYKPQDVKDEMISYAWYRFLKRGMYTIDATQNCFSYITHSFYINMLNRVMSLENKAIKQLQFQNQLLENLQYQCVDQFGQNLLNNDIDEN